MLQFIPTMFVVSLLSFYISVNSPGDPVDILSQSSLAQGGAASSYTITKQYKDSVRAQLGLNLPLFYFSLQTKSDCDTLYKITDKIEQYSFHRLSRKTGNWQNVAAFFNAIDKVSASYDKLNADSIEKANLALMDTTTELISVQLKMGDKKFERRLINSQTICFICVDNINENVSFSKNALSTLKKIYSTSVIKLKLDTLIAANQKLKYLPKQTNKLIALKKQVDSLEESSVVSNNYIPSFDWHGNSNQYHKWLVNLLHGDFGFSYVDTRPVAEKIWGKFFRSFTLVLLSVIIAYLISIPIGVYSAKNKGKFFDRFSSFMLFILFSIPSFFFGTILLYLFSNPQFFSWFPESGYCDPEFYNQNWTFIQKIYYTFPFIVLPLITYTYASFAFISRIIRSATLDVLNQDYIRTARAKGLSENKVIWKHAFRNALLPVITTFVTVFPAAVGGSVIIETIFTYDGMGIASYEAIGSKDIPMIVSIFSLAGFMSMVAYFLADILYALVDPRIRLK